MNRSKYYLGLLAIAVALVLLISAIGGGPSRTASNRDDDEAARQNAQLRYQLNWMFGSKAQHGWNIYLPLIKKLIKTNDEPASGKFAAAVAHWQKKAGKPVSGVLDDATLYAMIADQDEALTTDRLATELGSTVPLSRSRREDIEALRAFAAERFVPAR